MPGPTGTGGSVVPQQTRLAVSSLDIEVQRLFQQGLADSTRRSYQSGLKKFTEFCTLYSISDPYPISQSTLCYYVAHLSKQHLAPQSIKSYLSALRNYQISLDIPAPNYTAMHKLSQLKKGVAREYSKGHSPSVRLPITPPILRQVRALWSSQANDPDTIMLWAAACTCFFGFFRSGEITCPSVASFDPNSHLTFADIAVDNRTSPSCIRVHLKRSKTDQFGVGADVFLVRSSGDLCPVSALMAYLVVRGDQPGPLFNFRDGRTLSKPRFSTNVRAALATLGLNSSHYAGHSFRIGAATTAAEKGVEDSVIKAMGRWSSSAFLTYIRMPRQYLAAVATNLA